MLVDVQKRFLMYRMYPKYLAAPHFCRCEENKGVNIPSNGGCLGNNPGGLVTCGFPLQIRFSIHKILGIKYEIYFIL